MNPLERIKAMKYRHYLLTMLMAALLPFGLTGQDDIGYSHFSKYQRGGNQVCQDLTKTWSGGYLATGSTDYLWFPWEPKDESATMQALDAIILRFNAEDEYVWKKRYGGEADDAGNAMIEHSGGGVFVAGYTKSFTGDVSGNHGGSDFWLFKTNPSDLVWQKCYGGSNDEAANDLIETADGGLLLAGYTSSSDGYIGNSYGQEDAWLVKTGIDGALEWEESYGGSGNDRANQVLQTADGGYIIAGSKDSPDASSGKNTGDQDAWLIKVDNNGNLQWENTFGGPYEDAASSLTINNFGGYTFVGTTTNAQSSDVWVVAVDAQGNMVWQKTFGSEMMNDQGVSILQKSDGDYAISANMMSEGLTQQQNDIGLIILDHLGTVKHQSKFGNKYHDYASTVLAETDGSFLVAGSATTNENNGFDVSYVKTCLSKASEITMNPPHFCIYTNLSTSEEFDTYLWNTGETTRANYIDKMGFYSVNTNENGCNKMFSIVVPDPQPNTGVFEIHPVYEFYNCDSVMVSIDSIFLHTIWDFDYWHKQYAVQWGEVFHVTGIVDGGCESDDYFNAPDGPPTFSLQASFVTYDEVSGKNILVFPDVLEPQVIQLDILRSTQKETGYELVGQLDFSQSIWVDENSGADDNVYYYKLIAMDLCGAITGEAAIYASTQLKGQKNEDGSVNLSWNKSPNDCISRVALYRSVNGQNEQLLMDFSPYVQQITDPYPPKGVLRYWVRMTLSEECQAHTSSFPYASSNKIIVNTLGEDENILSFVRAFPNPFDEVLHLDFWEIHKAVKIELLDQWGQKLIETGFSQVSEATIPTVLLPGGLYFLRLTSGKNEQTFRLIKIAGK